MTGLIVGSFTGVFLLIDLALVVVKVFALADAVIRPERAWRIGTEYRKLWWVIGLAVGLVFFGVSIFGLAALVGAIVYLVDVRPKLRAATGGPRPW